MLRALAVHGFALLAAVEVEFGPGLNVLSGETGAGKSLVIDALGFVLGGRASADVVRAGAPAARVEALFETGDAGEQTLLSRELGADRHGSCHIDGRLATVALLRAGGEALVDIHGQGDHHSLLRPAVQLALLDAYAGETATALRRRREALMAETAALARTAEGLGADPGGRDLLAFQLQELDAAAVAPGEAEALGARRTVLQNVERLFAGAAAAYEDLRGQGGQAERLASLAAVDEQLRPAADLCRDAEVAAAEAAALLRRYRDGLAFEPGELDRVEARLAEIARLRRKYGDDLAAARQSLAERLAAIDGAAAERERLAARRTEIGAELTSVCGELVEVRRRAGGRLAEELAAELEPLAMPAARLSVELAPDASSGELLLAANPGEAALPLRRAASGGELSRCLLALQVILAERGAVGAQAPALVFDEVEAGLGGRAAEAVAERLWRLARGRQVICVTHQAGIAAAADRHLLIAKRLAGDRTETLVREIDGDERRDEVARMLSGRLVPASQRHAEVLLDRHRHGARQPAEGGRAAGPGGPPGT